MSIKVDKGIPLPDSSKGCGPIYPWGGMEIGDSFFVETDQKTVAASARGNAIRKGDGTKYATRSVTENGVKGTRVWRVK